MVRGDAKLTRAESGPRRSLATFHTIATEMNGELDVAILWRGDKTCVTSHLGKKFG
jgi:hypothetical protein